MDYRPWTWKLPENYKETQPKIVRQDAHEKVSGKAVYTRDIHLPGMLYAKIYTSPYAHAKIKSIDTSRAGGAAFYPGHGGVCETRCAQNHDRSQTH
jgi:xanthine dehydrogenase molybdopterin-binding subunit B